MVSPVFHALLIRGLPSTGDTAFYSTHTHTKLTQFRTLLHRASFSRRRRKSVVGSCGMWRRFIARRYLRKSQMRSPTTAGYGNAIQVCTWAHTEQDVEDSQTAILQTEEVLLEALCFDFVVATPHAELVDLFNSRQEKPEVEEYAWTIASDSYVPIPLVLSVLPTPKVVLLSRYRTPLCVLFPAQVIAAACYILAQQYAEGPSSLSLAARISSPAPSASLPTPPSHKSPFPDSARFAIDFFT